MFLDLPYVILSLMDLPHNLVNRLQRPLTALMYHPEPVPSLSQDFAFV